ncbi:MAG: AtpZ/AtpI family protein [Polyangiaceae bacterium]|nr:AtpZ/AtpI family protein [Polyangiaceae bacterium]
MRLDPGPAERFVSEVRRKAARMRSARRERRSFWSQVAHVGVLGWTFVLPVVAGAFAGRWLARSAGSRVAGVAPLLLGVAVGVYVVWRQVRQSLSDDGGSA